MSGNLAEKRILGMINELVELDEEVKKQEDLLDSEQLKQGVIYDDIVKLYHIGYNINKLKLDVIKINELLNRSV